MVLTRGTIIPANAMPKKNSLQMRNPRSFGPTLAMRWHHDDLVTKCSENQLWKVLGKTLRGYGLHYFKKIVGSFNVGWWISGGHIPFRRHEPEIDVLLMARNFAHSSLHSIYIIRTISSYLAAFQLWYIRILPCWSGAEIKCTVHVFLPKLPINQIKTVMQSRQKVLRAYCSNIYTIGPRLRVAQSFFKVNFGAPACHQPLTSCNKLANKPNRAQPE